MNEDDLIKLAAKAAGVAVEWSELYQRFEHFVDGKYMGAWSPLTDDGDALRLAVKLQILIDNHSDYTECYAPDMKTIVAESHKSDPLAATRRAIVRAAAAIWAEL